MEPATKTYLRFLNLSNLWHKQASYAEFEPPSLVPDAPMDLNCRTADYLLGQFLLQGTSLAFHGTASSVLSVSLW